MSQKQAEEKFSIVEKIKIPGEAELETVTYIKEKFLGKGGFAKCYEFTSSKRGKLAAKIIDKQTLTKSRAKAKLI